jgi:hypothetical protein
MTGTSDNGKQPVPGARKGAALPEHASGFLRPAIDQTVRDHLGASLRACYDDLFRPTMPDQFLHLLDRLERGEGRLPETLPKRNALMGELTP